MQCNLNFLFRYFCRLFFCLIFVLFSTIGYTQVKEIKVQGYPACANQAQQVWEACAEANGTTVGFSGDADPCKSDYDYAYESCIAKASENNPDSGLAEAGTPPPQVRPVTSNTSASDLNAIKSEFEGLIKSGPYKACEDAKEKANQCCDQPQTCLGEMMGASGGASTAVLQLLQLTGSTIIGINQMSGDIMGMCRSMGDVSMASMALNASMGTVCKQKVLTCTSTCGDLANQIEELNDRINSYVDSGSYGSDQSAKTTAFDLRTSIGAKNSSDRNGSPSKFVNLCKTYDNATVRAGQQVAANYQAVKMTELCKKQASLSNLDQPDMNVDCSTTGAASNPVCQQLCVRPGAENDPACYYIRQQMGLPNGTQGSNTPTPTGPDFDVATGLEDEQNPLFPNAVQSASGLAQAPGGSGGGGGGGLAGAPGGSDGGYGGLPAGESGFGSKILRGTNSGNGYTQSSMRTGGGGGGYSSGGSRSPASAGKKFSLKDFLPGGKSAPKRGLAGLSGNNPEIGAKTDDIFKRISGRFYQLCLQDRLYDCKTLRNMKKGQ